METKVVIPPRSHSNKVIIYVVVSVILMLISLYFFVGHFFKWWPYRSTDTSNTKTNTTNTKFNNSVFYFSITILIISVTVLIIILIASAFGTEKPGEIHHFKNIKPISRPVSDTSNNNIQELQSIQTQIKQLESRLNTVLNSNQLQ